MAGLLLLVLLAGYVVLFVYIFKRIRPVWAKVLAFLLFALIPTADAFYGRMKLRDLCAKEGGLKVYRTAMDVDGFLTDSLIESILRKYPFKFIETKELKGYARYSKSADGKITSEPIDSPQSRYEYQTTQGDSKDLYMKLTFAVRVRDTREILGLVNDFRYAGGWFERLMSASVAGRANAGHCPLPPYHEIEEQLIISTLKAN